MLRFLTKRDTSYLSLPLKTAAHYFSLINGNSFKAGHLLDLNKLHIKLNHTDSSQEQHIRSASGGGGEGGGKGSISSNSDSESSQLSDTFREIINKPFYGDSLKNKEKIYHLHAYCSINNTIVTLTNSDYNPVICVTSGMAGFKKCHRGGYEAGYQACMSLFKKMIQKEIRPTQLEIILRGFGKGREAIFKCVNGIDGAPFKSSVSRIIDATRINFGGVRKRKARRL
ncbi:hypothetical protein MERGE_000614 [Pneumocystis wakefieldiae]|uniref:Ribosomal protein S11 n=1 Tax=Pneumocystis wakefieldiae TaxID=38082 RepID=A0A899G458_9ASCO|nr:hypothetical protein MERGE_000614 [Pneumocystis wakefieldiae]